MTAGRGILLRKMGNEIRGNARFFGAVVVAAVALLSHYDIPFGDDVGDRLVIVSLLALPVFAFRGLSA